MSAAPGPQLRDIHLPAAPGWWPPAPGWWVLAVVCVLCVCFASYAGWRRYRRQRLRAAILAQLDRDIESAGGDPAALAATLSQFLRRMALREDPRAAALHGSAWLQWLDACINEQEFSSGVGRVLLDAPYRPVASFDAAALTALVRRWTRRVLDGGGAHA